MNIKQRVFVDIINQVPYGSNKMATRDNVSEAYAEELEKEPEAMTQAAAAAEKKLNRSLNLEDSFDKWLATCEIVHRAYGEVEQALEWLVEAGYLRKWTKKVRFGTATYHGLTEKGWSVADRYLALAKNKQH